jgi:hypothetical protein
MKQEPVFTTYLQSALFTGILLKILVRKIHNHTVLVTHLDEYAADHVEYLQHQLQEHGFGVTYSPDTANLMVRWTI